MWVNFPVTLTLGKFNTNIGKLLQLQSHRPIAQNRDSDDQISLVAHTFIYFLVETWINGCWLNSYLLSSGKYSKLWFLLMCWFVCRQCVSVIHILCFSRCLGSVIWGWFALASLVLNNGFIGSIFTDKKQNQLFYFRIWYRGIEAGIGKMQLKGEIIQIPMEIFCF